MEASKVKLVAPLFICIVLICCLRGIIAQSTKGGSVSASSFSSSSKGGEGKNGVISSSKFRANIESVLASLHQKKKIVNSAGKTNEISQKKTESFIQQQQQPIISGLHEVSSSSYKEDEKDEQQKKKQPVVNQVDEQNEEYRFYGSVEGVPGVDFPGYTSIPATRFTCTDLPYDLGMYADEETGCQVYHLCYFGRHESFLCGVGTLFNQENLNCDFWHRVECSKSSEFYSQNADFGKSLPEPSSVTFGTAVAVQQVPVKGGFSSKNSFKQQTIDSIQLPAVKGSSQVVISSEGSTKGGSGAFTGKQARTQSRTQVQAQTLTPIQVNKIRKSYMHSEQSVSSVVKAENKGRPVGATLNVVQSFSDDERGTINQASKVSSSLESGISLTSKAGKGVVKSSSSSDKKTDNDEWRPYFKSKSKSQGRSKIMASSTRSPQPTSSNSLEPKKSLAPANEEPSFRLTSSSSSKNNKNITTTLYEDQPVDTTTPKAAPSSSTEDHSSSSSTSSTEGAATFDEFTTTTTPTTSSPQESSTSASTEGESTSSSSVSDTPTSEPEVSTTMTECEQTTSTATPSSEPTTSSVEYEKEKTRVKGEVEEGKREDENNKEKEKEKESNASRRRKRKQSG